MRPPIAVATTTGGRSTRCRRRSTKSRAIGSSTSGWNWTVRTESPTIDVAALTALLDGEYADVRKLVRDNLAEHASILEDAETMSRDEFRQRERLDEVIVGTEVEGADAVGERVACGEDEYRHRGAAAPHALQQREAVGAGQADVDDREVE